jgi:hypothetical protein
MNYNLNILFNVERFMDSIPNCMSQLSVRRPSEESEWETKPREEAGGPWQCWWSRRK